MRVFQSARAQVQNVVAHQQLSFPVSTQEMELQLAVAQAHVSGALDGTTTHAEMQSLFGYCNPTMRRVLVQYFTL